MTFSPLISMTNCSTCSANHIKKLIFSVLVIVYFWCFWGLNKQFHNLLKAVLFQPFPPSIVYNQISHQYQSLDAWNPSRNLMVDYHRGANWFEVGAKYRPDPWPVLIPRIHYDYRPVTHEPNVGRKTCGRDHAENCLWGWTVLTKELEFKCANHITQHLVIH